MKYTININGEEIEIPKPQQMNLHDMVQLELEIEGTKYLVYMECDEFNRLCKQK